MSDYLVNSSPLEEIYTHPEQPLGRDFECDNFKNIEYSHLSRIQVSPYCKKILDIMNSCIVKPLKHQYVFIKVQDLKVGDQTSGTGHWHLDSSLNPDHFYENFIFVTGQHNTTEFATRPLVLPKANSSMEFDKLIKRFEFYDGLDKFFLKPLTIYKYNGTNVHRGRTVKIPEKRILIRLSNTDRKLTVYK